MVLLPDGERLATLEQAVRDLRDDVLTVGAQMERTRTRLHNLEGFAQSYLDTQQSNRRQEADQYRRMGNRIALAGLALTFGLLVLAAITAYIHHG